MTFVGPSCGGVNRALMDVVRIGAGSWEMDMRAEWRVLGHAVGISGRHHQVGLRRGVMAGMWRVTVVPLGRGFRWRVPTSQGLHSHGVWTVYVAGPRLLCSVHSRRYLCVMLGNHSPDCRCGVGQSRQLGSKAGVRIAKILPTLSRDQFFRFTIFWSIEFVHEQ